MKLNLENIFAVEEHGLKKSDVDDKMSEIPSFREAILARGQGFTDFGLVEKALAEVKNVKLDKNVENVILLGVGGSALGPRMIFDAFGSKNGVKLMVLDNVDPELIDEAVKSVDLAKTVFLVFTKSGETPETLAQYLFFRDLLKKEIKNVKPNKFTSTISSPAKSRTKNTQHYSSLNSNFNGFGARMNLGEKFLIASEKKESAVTKIAKKDGSRVFEIPVNLGGRFSVNGVVGLLVLRILGHDARGFADGLAAGLDRFANDGKENLGFLLAAVNFELFRQKGVKIMVTMPYSQKLATFSAWCAQLVAESLGKDGKGLTPVGAVGVTDQHSQIQLFNDGPRDKIVQFLTVENVENDFLIAGDAENDAPAFLKNVSFKKLLDVEQKATASALAEHGRANLAIEIEKIDEKNLGELVMIFETMTAFLGEMFGVDAFDQPGVELGKVLTRKFLS